MSIQEKQDRITELEGQRQQLAAKRHEALAVLGEAVYPQLKDSAARQVYGVQVDAVERVDASLDTATRDIEELKAEIEREEEEKRHQKEEKGKTRICTTPGCDNVIYDGDKFCSRCGTPVAEMVFDDSVIVCPRCGYRGIEPGMSFCQN